MAGTGWQSPDLLARFNRMAGRPSSTTSGVDAMPDSLKYQILDEGQEYVLTQIANTCGKILYGPPIQLTSTDGGFTFGFGTDGEGYATFPLGKGGVFPSLNAIPAYPWTPGVDYLDQGTTIRMPNNMQWGGNLYWYGITPPAALSDTSDPVIQPPAARILIVIAAVRIFAEDYAGNPGLAVSMDNRWRREYGPWLTQMRRHLRGTGNLGPLTWPAGVAGPWGPGLGGTWWG